ncbi:MAG: hypothetical protein KJ018_03320 [Burkholderiales bacterium]|nr:hypothetical protein [Burkholderiales bacterium]GIK86199.1 MAG: hypothetical protein BroJett026_16800 [Betaproteobacteria bacterium]
MSRERAAATWFSFGLRLFALTLPLGIVVALLTPFGFVQALGAFVFAGSAAGLLLSAAGLRSEAPASWAAWQQAWRRAPAPVRLTAQRR